MALEVEEILEGLRETLSEGINRVRRLIDSFPTGRREKPMICIPAVGPKQTVSSNS